MNDERERARRLALKLLATREHARSELLGKLALRGIADELARDVLDELAAARLQSDDRYVESFIESRRARGIGPRRIEAELRERGADAETVRLRLGSDADWDDCLEQARCRRFGTGLPATRAEYARQARFLATRGFPLERIRRRLERRD